MKTVERAIKSLVFGVCALSAGPAMAGNEVFATTGSFIPPPFGPPRQLVRIDLDTGATTVVGDLTEGISELAYDPASRTLFGGSLGSNLLYKINPRTAALTPIGPYGVNGFLLAGLEWDQSTGTLYGMGSGVVPSNPNAELARINHLTGATTVIGRAFTNRLSFPLGYDSVNDAMYVGAHDGLHTIDLATGVATRIGGGTLESLAFDPAYGMLSATGSTINRIDLATGLATPLVTHTAFGVAGLAFVPAPGILAFAGVGGLWVCRRRRSSAA